MDDFDVVSGYSLDEAIEDGVLVKILEYRWPELSGGKPIVATSHIFSNISLAGIMEIWNEFVKWRQKNNNPQDMFITEMDNSKVWVIEDSVAFTILYPEDY